MTKIGILSDPHAGYSRGTKEVDGINVREQDILDAVTLAVHNLMEAKVDVIVSLGDDFHVPAPKKRALLHMIRLVNESDLNWFAVMGNHTLVRTASDINVYTLMEAMCPRFMGFTEPTYVEDIKAYLIPYGPEHEALKSIPNGTQWIGGHWAAENAGFPGEHVPLADLPTDIPTLLGHYHTRQIAKDHVATYVGATERYAWGEANNPTGVAIFDTKTKKLDFIDHKTREWVDVSTNAERVLDDLRGRDLEGKIVRVSVEATPPEYHGLDIKSVRDIARGALEFQIRRSGQSEQFAPTEHTDTQTYSLLDAWQQHTASLKPAEMRKAVQGLGSKALAGAGVGE